LLCPFKVKGFNQNRADSIGTVNLALLALLDKLEMGPQLVIDPGKLRGGFPIRLIKKFKILLSGGQIGGTSVIFLYPPG
jgi:hypothetical protein